ncbi:MAG: OmpH family outer membrane protein [Bacteroidia bacterium]|nr:OmpH family outer membrane protein [Bacteroidia bacterium]
MNKISIALNVFFALALGVLFYFQFTGRNVNHSGGPKDTLAGAITIAYVNTDTLWKNYEKVKEMEGELERSNKRMDDDLKNKGRALEQEYYNYQERIQSGQVTQEQAQEKEAKIMQDRQELMQLQQEYEDQASRETMKKNEELRKEIFAFIEKYNKENDNYTFILSYSSIGSIMVADTTLDITKPILDGLNEAYKKNKKK